MKSSLLSTILIALFIAAAVPMSASANQKPQNPPNPTPLDPGEPRYYEQFDCRAINTLIEWEACTNEPQN